MWEVDCFLESLAQLSLQEKNLQATENSLKEAEKEQQKAQDGKTSAFKKLFSNIVNLYTTSIKIYCKTDEDRVNAYQTKINNVK